MNEEAALAGIIMLELELKVKRTELALMQAQQRVAELEGATKTKAKKPAQRSKS